MYHYRALGCLGWKLKTGCKDMAKAGVRLSLSCMKPNQPIPRHEFHSLLGLFVPLATMLLQMACHMMHAHNILS